MSRVHRAPGRILMPIALMASAAASLAAGSEKAAADAPGRPITVYVGTYTGGDSRGIYRFTLDAETGATTAPVLAAESENPSFLALSPDGGRLYAVNETDDFDAEGSGGVSAYSVERSSGSLRLLNARSSRGAHPCHLALDRDGRHVLVANYGGGNVAVLPVADDGSLRPASSALSHSGRGPRTDRQEAPHAHAVALDPSGRFALAADLGADRLFVYRFLSERGRIEPHDPPSVALPPGAGPRHVAFHPSGRVLYSIDELLSTITVFAWDEDSGRLAPVETVSTLPPGYGGENTTAEIAVSADGRFVYGSNRGHDSLAVFRVEDESGRLEPAGHVPSGGKTPRHFALDPSGRWLLAANQGTGEVVVFRVDAATGLPRPAGATVRVDRPVCVLPVPRD